jgi:hypothetical protein
MSNVARLFLALAKYFLALGETSLLGNKHIRGTANIHRSCPCLWQPQTTSVWVRLPNHGGTPPGHQNEAQLLARPEGSPALANSVDSRLLEIDILVRDLGIC